MTRWPPGDPRARRTDPKTSHDAAASVDASRNQASVLMVMRQIGPCTEDELVRGYQNLLNSPYWTKSIALQPEESIRKRRSELKDRGLVEATTLKRKGASGRLQTVYRALEGREIAANEGALGKIIEELQEQAKRDRTEGSLFDPDQGKPRRYDNE